MIRLAGILLDETVREVFYAPLWWYTRGAVRAIDRFRARVRDANDHLALLIWMRSIFIPMYGQYDFAGRLISIVMRCLQIFIRGVVFVVWTAISFVLLLAYFLLPLVVLVQLYAVWKN